MLDSAKLFLGGLLGLVLMGTIACKPPAADDGDDEHPATPIEADDAADVLAQQICAQLFECSCAVGYVDEASCVEYQRQAIAATIDPVLDAGGTWDPECAGQMAKAMADWECLGPTMASWEATFDGRACPVLKGTNAATAECSYSILGDDCRDGLMCIASTCVDALTLPVPVGEPCNYEWENLPCEAGSFCAWDENYEFRYCQPLPKAGDSCINGDYLCGPAANDLICEIDTCVPAPGEGEPCFEGWLCGPGTYCDGGKDFTCTARREVGEGCGADSVCPVDASCINNICEADAAMVCSVPNWF